MRVLRHNVALALVLAGLWGAHASLAEPVASPGRGEIVFEGFVADAVTQVEIAGADGTSLVLRRREGAWTLPERFDMEAHGYNLERLFAAVANVRATELVSDSHEGREVYGVGDAGTRVVLSGGGGVVLASFVQGREVPTRGSASAGSAGTFLRPASATETYRAPGLAPLSTNPDDWLDTRFAKFDHGSVRAFRAGPAGEGVELRRASEGWELGRWSDDGESRGFETVGDTLVDEFLAELAGLYFERAVGAGLAANQGLEPAVWSCDLDLGDARRLSLHIGGPSGPDARYAARVQEPHTLRVVTLSSSVVDALLAAYDRLVR